MISASSALATWHVRRAAVNNQGTFTKSGSAATSTISTLFNNTGTVNVQSGTLNLSGGGTDVGAIYTGAGTVEFSGGTRTLDAASSITAANATFSGGTTTVNGRHRHRTCDGHWRDCDLRDGRSDGPVALTQTGGELNGNGTLTVTGPSAACTGGTQSGSGTTNAQGGASFSGHELCARRRADAAAGRRQHGDAGRMFDRSERDQSEHRLAMPGPAL